MFLETRPIKLYSVKYIINKLIFSRQKYNLANWKIKFENYCDTYIKKIILFPKLEI